MSMTVYASCLLSAALLGGAEQPGDAPAPVPTCEGPRPRPQPGKLVCVTYAVADLVVPIDQVPCPDEGTPAGPNPAGSGAGTRWGQTMEDRLIRLICTSIQPGSWSENGGAGTIQYFPLGMALVISQRQDVQEEIADLLAALRRLQDVEVAVEIRLLSVSEASFERLGAASQALLNLGEPASPDQAAGAHELAFLNDKQVRQLLETAQGDRRTSVMQAPMITVFSGQKATLSVTDRQYFVTGFKVMREAGQAVAVPKNEGFDLGLRFLIQPAVSADRRSVLMNFRAELTELESLAVPVVPVQTHLMRPLDEGSAQVVPVQQFVQQPSIRKMKVDKCFQTADGKTAVLHWGTRLVEERAECESCPVLSKVPYLNRLFRNVGYGRQAQHLVLLITPRVIINEEEEQLSSSTLSPISKP
jgi:general secretion pathway protein D